MKVTMQILLIISGLVLIVSTLLQDSKSSGFSSSIAGGAEQLFQNRKTNGFQKILSRITVISAIVVLGLTVLGMFYYK